MALYILGLLILFILGDIFFRYLIKKQREKKQREEREKILDTGMQVDFSSDAPSLKRAEVNDPKAKILCVDDEDVILDSFRKILVLDGYTVDTVNTGQEALGLIQRHHYDFVFTDLKMPEMDGVEVTKSVKYLRPDIDVIIITGYASVETAVETMQYGAMDYIQKPFTEEELLEMTKKSLIKRRDRIDRELKPKVQITHSDGKEPLKSDEYSIPGGVFISEGHSWASIDQDGTVKVGLDDFSKKILGKIDSIEFPNLGMEVVAGKTLFSVRQGKATIPFEAPVSGKVAKINENLKNDPEALDVTSYEKNWVCVIDAEKLDEEIRDLKIGKAAVTFYEHELELYQQTIKKMKKYVEKPSALDECGELYIGAVEKIDEFHKEEIVEKFFNKTR